MTKPFGKEFQIALLAGFLVGCAGMVLNVNGLVGNASAAAIHGSQSSSVQGR